MNAAAIRRFKVVVDGQLHALGVEFPNGTCVVSRGSTIVTCEELADVYSAFAGRVQVQFVDQVIERAPQMRNPVLTHASSVMNAGAPA